MLWIMILGRALAAAIYVLATLLWAGAMVLGRLVGCEGDCLAGEAHRMDLSVVLALVGLGVATAALLGGMLRRWIGLTLLGSHLLVFAVNLGIFWGLAGDPWVFIPPAALAAAAGYFALGGLRPPSAAGWS